MLSRTILTILILASTASADPHTIRFENASPERAIAAVRVCAINPGRADSCADLTAPCGPSETCETEADLSPGQHEIYLRAAPEGSEWSEESNRESVTVHTLEASEALRCMASTGCRADFDGDGSVTASDFGFFLEELARGVWD